MLQPNGERLIVVYAGDAWELEEGDPHNWHLIRHGITISMPKLVDLDFITETYADFKNRLAVMSDELLSNDAKAAQCL